ncbi:MAG: hypothetical protein EON87_06030 [Brevundimonas sp.]|nr:MAG: hypothetical protein EON87_06030 [Brevundimonas sp.]
MDLAGLFRDRWAERMTNDGDVRNIGGFEIDVAGKATRGQEPYTSAVTPGSGTTLYDPARPPHAPPPLDAGLPQASLFVLQDDLREQYRAAKEADATNTVSPDQNPYGVMMPSHVVVQHYEETRPEQITTVGYFGEGVGPGAAGQKAYTMEQVDKLKALAKIERDLSAEYGEPVKLAWDGASGEYMMLREGQAGYNHVRSVNELVRNLPKDLKELNLFTFDEIARMTI